MWQTLWQIFILVLLLFLGCFYSFYIIIVTVLRYLSDFLYVYGSNYAQLAIKYVIVTPGGTVQYDVPIMKVQTYSLNDIFEKDLLMLFLLSYL